MNIRLFRESDLDQCLELGRIMHEESSFRVHPFVPERVAALATVCMTDSRFVAFVAERDGRIMGMFVGLIGDHYFSDATYATDMLLYVHPQDRGSTAAIRLMSTFEKWAVDKGCCEIRVGAATGIDPQKTDRFFRGIGYSQCGIQYLKRIGPLNTAH